MNRADDDKAKIVALELLEKELNVDRTATDYLFNISKDVRHGKVRFVPASEADAALTITREILIRFGQKIADPSRTWASALSSQH